MSEEEQQQLLSKEEEEEEEVETEENPPQEKHDQQQTQSEEKDVFEERMGNETEKRTQEDVLTQIREMQINARTAIAEYERITKEKCNQERDMGESLLNEEEAEKQTEMLEIKKNELVKIRETSRVYLKELSKLLTLLNENEIPDGRKVILKIQQENLNLSHSYYEVSNLLEISHSIHESLFKDDLIDQLDEIVEEKRGISPWIKYSAPVVGGLIGGLVLGPPGLLLGMKTGAASAIFGIGVGIGTGKFIEKKKPVLH